MKPKQAASLRKVAQLSLLAVSAAVLLRPAWATAPMAILLGVLFLGTGLDGFMRAKAEGNLNVSMSELVKRRPKADPLELVSSVIGLVALISVLG